MKRRDEYVRAVVESALRSVRLLGIAGDIRRWLSCLRCEIQSGDWTVAVRTQFEHVQMYRVRRDGLPGALRVSARIALPAVSLQLFCLITISLIKGI